jgi:hypothetical protein
VTDLYRSCHRSSGSGPGRYPRFNHVGYLSSCYTVRSPPAFDLDCFCVQTSLGIRGWHLREMQGAPSYAGRMIGHGSEARVA